MPSCPFGELLMQHQGNVFHVYHRKRWLVDFLYILCHLELFLHKTYIQTEEIFQLLSFLSFTTKLDLANDIRNF